MKRILYLPVVLVLLAPVGADPAQAVQGKLAKLMEDKLQNAKLLLEGVAVGNFEKINDAAERLIQLSKTAEWFVHKTPRFEMHSNEFRRAAEVLIQKAKAKSLDGVALGYVDLTMACFRCHQYVREVRDARLGPSGLEALAGR